MPDGGLVVSANHRAARAYASHGWKVFPCLPDQKEPACAGGLHAATTDLEQIDRWWMENPHYNIAGDPESAGLSVVDIDAKRQPDGTKGVDTWRRLVEQHGAPNTYWVATPSGGWHVYFRGELPTTAGKIAPGIDTRGAGRGYVLLAPSTFKGVAYRPSIEHAPGEPPAGAFAPVPEWITHAVTTPRYCDQATREYVERSQKVPVPENELIAILRHLDPDCAYDPWYVYIGAIRGTRLAGVAEEETDARLLDIAQAWSRGDYWPLGPTRWSGDDDVEAKFWAMPPKPGGTTFGTLWRAARAAGYDKPPPQLPDDDMFVGVEYPIVAKENDRAAVDEGRWPLMHIRDRATALSRPDPEMLVAEIIPDKKLIMPWGDTGCGKTYWSVEIATAVAMRRSAFGKFPIVKPGDAGIAVIFAGEDCDFLDKSRLTAIEQHHQRSLQGLVYTVETAIPINDPSLFEAYRDELRRLQDITGKPIDVVLNDTLKRSLGLLKQNDDDTARRFTMAMEGLVAEFACPILCNAHQPKSGADGGVAGSGDFTANCPVTPHLVAEHDSTGRLAGIRCRFEPKFRVGPMPLPFTVRTVSVPLPRPVAGITSDLVLTALSAEEEAGRVTPARAARLSEQEDCREIERVCRERAAHDLDSGITTEVLTTYLAGNRREGEAENDHAQRRHEWKQRLDNGARRPKGNPYLAGYFAMDHRGDGTLRVPRPVRKWFVPRAPDGQTLPW